MGLGGPGAGDCHFNDGESWIDRLSAGPGIRLLETAIHEIGHGLGLEHSDDNQAVMFPSYDPSKVKVTLGNCVGGEVDCGIVIDIGTDGFGTDGVGTHGIGFWAKSQPVERSRAKMDVY